MDVTGYVVPDHQVGGTLQEPSPIRSFRGMNSRQRSQHPALFETKVRVTDNNVVKNFDTQELSSLN